MQMKYLILAFGILCAGQAVASPIQVATNVASAPFEVREVGGRAAYQPYQSPRHEDAQYLEVRTDTPLAVMAHPHDDTLEIEEKHSARGKKYHLVRPKGSAATEAAARKNGDTTLQRRGDPIFKKAVYWPRGGHGDTGSRFAEDTGVLQWNIGVPSLWVIFYSSRLNVNIEYHRNYGFTDEEGDTYWCNVYVSGMHYIDYNSGAPSIVQVQAY